MLGRTIQAPSSDGEAFRYRLGPGDRLSMKVFKMDGYSANVEVLSDGTINLPRLGTVDVWGLTLEEAKAVDHRWLQRDPAAAAGVSGSVGGPSDPRDGDWPGVETRRVLAAIEGPPKGSGWPTLVDVVQKAGGMSASADLSSVEVMRPSAGPAGSPRRIALIT